MGAMTGRNQDAIKKTAAGTGDDIAVNMNSTAHGVKTS